MKTIAITVDDQTLELLDRLAESTEEFRNRSALVRAAIREFAHLDLKRRQEERERDIIHRNRERLAREAKALVDEQARV